MEFQKFKKIPRLSRNCIITEKIDGTNASIVIKSYSFLDVSDCQFITKYALNLPEDFNEGTFNFSEQDLFLFAGSKSRWLDTSSNGDNYGFAKWVKENAEELLKLGGGIHYGEWYGKRIQRNYGLNEKRFALFNVGKWDDENKPNCCEVVPIIAEGIFDTDLINASLHSLIDTGSYIVPGFKNPEGIIIYHKASGQLFKKTIENDEKPKNSKE